MARNIGRYGAYYEKSRQNAKVDYFDEDDENDINPTTTTTTQPANNDDEEVDPLDAFMMGINTQVKSAAAATTTNSSSINEATTQPSKPRILQDEVQDSFEIKRQNNLEATEETDNIIPSQSKRVIEDLAPKNHSGKSYEVFRKCFYTPHRDVSNMTLAEVSKWRFQQDVAVFGKDIEAFKPVLSFAHVGFNQGIIKSLVHHELSSPTPIQAQSFPIALSGRDLIGIAKTGSGKTYAYVLPMIMHLMDQRLIERGEGPIAVVLTPTRELAHQIYIQTRKFAQPQGATVIPLYGGAQKWEQIQALRSGGEVVVGTPGRVIEMIKKKHAPMTRVTFLVLDEADIMFNMGFENQVRSIVGQIRPDRQTLLFSATFRKTVETLARDVLTNPVRITIGKIGQANSDIQQVAIVMPGSAGKWKWICSRLKVFTSLGKTLIFVSSKAGCEELGTNLNSTTIGNVECIHGDKTQSERSLSLQKFRDGGSSSILVATDVASRGLDIKNVRTVVNYDVAKNIETHIHRIGRTGRMGKTGGVTPGTAYTLVTAKDYQFAGNLVNNMDLSRQEVPDALLSLAQRDSRFFRRHYQSKGLQKTAVTDHHQRSQVIDDATEHTTTTCHTKAMNKSKAGLGYNGRESSSTNLKGFVKSSIAEDSAIASSDSSTLKIIPPPASAPPPPAPKQQLPSHVLEAIQRINASCKAADNTSTSNGSGEGTTVQHQQSRQHRSVIRSRTPTSPESYRKRTRHRSPSSSPERRHRHHRRSQSRDDDKHRSRHRHHRRR